ncbi:MAG: HAMP domain-containing histidine kinase [Saprospiraceae bacterium]|nr:HAMP domain-containing histidine kinase [Saprospiraceae bacterium]
MGYSHKKNLLRFLLIVVGVLGIAFLSIYFLFQLDLKREFEQKLQARIEMASSMIVGNQFPTRPPSFIDEGNPLSLSYAYQENVTVYDLHGNRLFALNPSPAGLDPELLNMIRLYREYRFTHEHYEALGVLWSNGIGDQYLIIAEAIPDQGDLVSLLIILSVVFVCLVGMILAGGWFFAERTLSSVTDLSTQLQGLAPADLGRRLSGDHQRKELDGLVQTFNNLLDRIQDAFRVQKLFLANMAHEMRNPLQGILTDIQTVTDENCAPEKRIQILNEVLLDVRELNEVADKLMILARQESEQSVILFVPFRIDELIWQARASLVKTNPQYQVLFEIASLPEKEEGLVVHGNELLIKTAFLNLMENGCKFSPDHQVHIRLGFLEDGRAKVTISDHGPGIPESERSRIFQPFYRSAQTAHIRGSGIGLALVEGILKLHHIQLSIQDHTGGGTSFMLTFPDGTSQDAPSDL